MLTLLLSGGFPRKDVLASQSMINASRSHISFVLVTVYKRKNLHRYLGQTFSFRNIDLYGMVIY